MKKFIILLIALVFFSSFVQADETKIIQPKISLGTITIVGTVCLEGFLFAYVSTPYEGGTHIIQVYGQSNLPVKCK
jgi:hypothetical protein